MVYDRMLEFLRFVNDEILPATNDIGKLEDRNRVHVQKLVYTNLVDRFDSMIDGAILDNCREDRLRILATSDLNKPITKAELIKLVMSGDVQEAIDIQLKDALRTGVLRQRHSKKLSSLFGVLQPEQECWNTPRVNRNLGSIAGKIKVLYKPVPHSICGYADWLYSRRNTIVHGGGSSKFLPNDVEQLNKLFKCTPTKTFRISLGSIKVAAAFYENVTELLIG